jgi:hypothetical protein
MVGVRCCYLSSANCMERTCAAKGGTINVVHFAENIEQKKQYKKID